jgi:CMP-2-keto-3-deoxyoctulosonic acid synthetase
VQKIRTLRDLLDCNLLIPARYAATQVYLQQKTLCHIQGRRDVRSFCRKLLAATAPGNGLHVIKDDSQVI